jgi:hypothetical protein
MLTAKVNLSLNSIQFQGRHAHGIQPAYLGFFSTLAAARSLVMHPAMIANVFRTNMNRLIFSSPVEHIYKRSQRQTHCLGQGFEPYWRVRVRT